MTASFPLVDEQEDDILGKLFTEDVVLKNQEELVVALYVVQFTSSSDEPFLKI